jgi:hypothetical protein
MNILLIIGPLLIVILLACLNFLKKSEDFEPVQFDNYKITGTYQPYGDIDVNIDDVTIKSGSMSIEYPEYSPIT